MFKYKTRRLLLLPALLMIAMLALAGCKTATDGEDLAMRPVEELSTMFTETELTTPVTFAETEYPLLASLPEYQIYLYAIDKNPTGGRVMLRVGNQFQEYNWNWRNADFQLPRLGIEVLNRRNDFAIHCALVLSSAEHYEREELHYLFPHEEGYWDLVVTTDMLRSALAGRLSGGPNTENEKGFYLAVDEVRYSLLLPEQLVGKTASALDDVSTVFLSQPYMQNRPDEMVEAGFQLRFSDADEAFYLGRARFGLHDAYVPENYRYEAEPTPAVELEIPLGVENAKFVLEYVQSFYLEGHDLPILPDTVNPVDISLPELVDTESVHSYQLPLPGYWQQEYQLQRAGDEGSSPNLLFNLYDDLQYYYGASGWLFGIDAYPLAGFATQFANELADGFAGNTRVLGQNDRHVFLLHKASDVQYNPDERTSTVRYSSMSQYIEPIAQRFVEVNGLREYDPNAPIPPSEPPAADSAADSSEPPVADPASDSTEPPAEGDVEPLE